MKNDVTERHRLGMRGDRTRSLHGLGFTALGLGYRVESFRV